MITRRRGTATHLDRIEADQFVIRALGQAASGLASRRRSWAMRTRATVSLEEPGIPIMTRAAARSSSGAGMGSGIGSEF